MKLCVLRSSHGSVDQFLPCCENGCELGRCSVCNLKGDICGKQPVIEQGKGAVNS